MKVRKSINVEKDVWWDLKRLAMDSEISLSDYLEGIFKNIPEVREKHEPRQWANIEEKDKLRNIQKNTTTGTPHNEQLIYTQVESIFALDKLAHEISILKNVLESSSKQNEKLTQSNHILQLAMFI